jgi:hypothetical protein
MVACALAPGPADICAASLKFFLATQAQVSTRISAANLNGMENALSSFLAERNIWPVRSGRCPGAVAAAPC